MIFFPSAKINLGLQITKKRVDGFHDINTVFFPVNWCDIIEVSENKFYQKSEDSCSVISSGLKISGDKKDNLIVKAYELLSIKKALPPLTVQLHKTIPMGAGLGGGSSDAAFFIKGLNEYFNLNFTMEELKQLASKIGSDCPFFIENKPVFATGLGNEFIPIELSLRHYKIVIVYPNQHSNTKLAYSNVSPTPAEINLIDIIQNNSVNLWKDVIKNDFEDSVFKAYPIIQKLKVDLYKQGAVYASMSGSGSAVYGIFEKNNFQFTPFSNEYPSFIGDLNP